MRLPLERNEHNIARFEALSCDEIVAELSRETTRAYAVMPSTEELCEAWSDATNRRIYASVADVERLWLDRYLQANPLTFDRGITHLAKDH